LTSVRAAPPKNVEGGEGRDIKTCGQERPYSWGRAQFVTKLFGKAGAGWVLKRNASEGKAGVVTEKDVWHEKKTHLPLISSEIISER